VVAVFKRVATALVGKETMLQQELAEGVPYLLPSTVCVHHFQSRFTSSLSTAPLIGIFGHLACYAV
jgi:hypothetical protein